MSSLIVLMSLGKCTPIWLAFLKILVEPGIGGTESDVLSLTATPYEPLYCVSSQDS